jgi:predicted SAM-dependent methyltransferase
MQIKKLLGENGNINLEIGAGEKKGHDNWTTMDENDLCDLKWDTRKGIPFPADRLSSIYSSHMFEHLTFTQIEAMLAECKRVLKTNGIFSICVPNARMYLEAYLNNDKDFWNRKPGGRAVTAFNNTTAIDCANYIAYMDGLHKYMFDEENLVFILKKNGFRNARVRSFDPAIDMQDRDFDSIYAIAEK